MTQERAISGALRSTSRPKSSAALASEKPTPFGVVVRDLLIQHGYVTQIGNPNWMEFSRQLRDVKYESLRKAVTGEREPGVKIMESVAQALGIKPCVFWEYQLAVAQRSFDPREVGEDEAFANLQKWLAKQA